MSEDIGEEGQQSRDGLSAPNSEPGSAAQSPRGDQHDEEDDENGEGEGEEGEGEEGEDGQDESDSEGDENGEDEAQEAQEGQVTGEAGERPENTAEPQRQASTAAADQKQAQPAKPAPSKEKRGRVRKWERKLVRIGHLQLLKWVPLEPREASQIERSEKAAMLKRQVSDSAPVTRSTTAAYHQRVRLERRAATRNVSYRDQEEESADPSDADDSAVTGKRRRDDD